LQQLQMYLKYKLLNKQVSTSACNINNFMKIEFLYKFHIKVASASFISAFLALARA